MTQNWTLIVFSLTFDLIYIYIYIYVIYLANPKIPVERCKIEGAYSISLLYLISFYDMTTLSI